jgi:3-methyl-2-oxobutanoate hydroxymethyltransferase
MVIQGNDDTLPVTIEDMIYHTRIVANIVKRAWVIADMPFGSYTSKVDAFENAKKLMQAGAKMVKMEGGEWLLPIVKFLTERGIPVCAHLGLTPQSVHQIGGYRIQAKDADGQAQLLKDAKDLEAAGATMLVLELMPSVPAQQVTDALQIPTIGIGAGSDTSGQVLVIYDIINLYPGKKARFVKNYLAGKDNIFDAIADYVSEVKSGAFPAAEHSYE